MDMSIRDEDVLKPVLIEVKEIHAPRQIREADGPGARGIRPVCEEPIAIIVIERVGLVLEVGNTDV